MQAKGLEKLEAGKRGYNHTRIIYIWILETGKKKGGENTLVNLYGSVQLK